MFRYSNGVSILLMVMALAACGGSGGSKTVHIESTDEQSAPKSYEPPVAANDGWPVDAAGNRGMSEAVLTDLLNATFQKQFGDMDAMVIAKDGALVFEWYGRDMQRTTRHESYSVSKSVISLLVGISNDAGLIPDIDAKVVPAFSEYSPLDHWDDRKNDITIRHLLTMTSGLDCDDTNMDSPGNELTMFVQDDWVKYFLDLPQINDPGSTYSYCAGSVVTLAGLIHSAGPLTSHEFADQNLFSPLGIVNYNWTSSQQNRLHPNGLQITARDLAKIGQVMLTGSWDDYRIVSDAWIAESTSTQVTMLDGDTAGYQWNLVTEVYEGKSYEMFFAYGRGGQALLVIPSENLVMSMFAANFDNRDALDNASFLVNNFLLDAL